jgi:alpha-L-fucosidase 2
MLPRWKDMLENITSYPVDERGLKIGRNLSFDRPHRHYSHLFSIFPLYETNIENRPDFLPVMKTSLHNFTDLTGDSCMFKFTGASSLWAALGDGNEALKWLKRSIQYVKKGPTFTPNGFYSENGWPTFESPVSACRAALDMYIQSWGNKIRVFPAMPDAWKEACFYHLRAEGGFVVSAKRTKGKTDFISITSEAGEPCVLKTDMVNPISLNNKTLKISKITQQEYSVEIKKGESVTLVSKGQNPNLMIEPIRTYFNIEQYFGLSK